MRLARCSRAEHVGALQDGAAPPRQPCPRRAARPRSTPDGAASPPAHPTASSALLPHPWAPLRRHTLWHALRLTPHAPPLLTWPTLPVPLGRMRPTVAQPRERQDRACPAHAAHREPPGEWHTRYVTWRAEADMLTPLPTVEGAWITARCSKTAAPLFFDTRWRSTGRTCWRIACFPTTRRPLEGKETCQPQG